MQEGGAHPAPGTVDAGEAAVMRRWALRAAAAAAECAAAGGGRNAALIVDPAAGALEGADGCRAGGGALGHPAGALVGQGVDGTRAGGGTPGHPLRHAVMVALGAVAERDCRLWPESALAAARAQAAGSGKGAAGEGSPSCQGFGAEAPRASACQLLGNGHATPGVMPCCKGSPGELANGHADGAHAGHSGSAAGCAGGPTCAAHEAPRADGTAGICAARKCCSCGRAGARCAPAAPDLAELAPGAAPGCAGLANGHCSAAGARAALTNGCAPAAEAAQRPLPPGAEQGAAQDVCGKPYLCTGFDCYVVAEPCAMCAMALVHSRVRRVVFCEPDQARGALGGRFRLHGCRSLNHHYQVYRCLLPVGDSG